MHIYYLSPTKRHTHTLRPASPPPLANCRCCWTCILIFYAIYKCNLIAASLKGMKRRETEQNRTEQSERWQKWETGKRDCELVKWWSLSMHMMRMQSAFKLSSGINIKADTTRTHTHTHAQHDWHSRAHTHTRRLALLIGHTRRRTCHRSEHLKKLWLLKCNQKLT